MKQSKQTKKSNSVSNKSNSATEKKHYYVNIEGEDVEIQVKDEGEYSCILNCLEGYYIYGIDCE